MKKPIKKAAAKKISEYGGMEKYTSKKAEMKHEKKEGKKVEAKVVAVAVGLIGCISGIMAIIYYYKKIKE